MVCHTLWAKLKGCTERRLPLKRNPLKECRFTQTSEISSAQSTHNLAGTSPDVSFVGGGDHKNFRRLQSWKSTSRGFLQGRCSPGPGEWTWGHPASLQLGCEKHLKMVLLDTVYCKFVHSSRWLFQLSCSLFLKIKVYIIRKNHFDLHAFLQNFNHPLIHWTLSILLCIGHWHTLIHFPSVWSGGLVRWTDRPVATNEPFIVSPKIKEQNAIYLKLNSVQFGNIWVYKFCLIIE